MCVCVCAVVTVEITEADYQTREGIGPTISARVSYNRDLANNIDITFFPVTYTEYVNLGFTLPQGFPSRPNGAEFEARGNNKFKKLS